MINAGILEAEKVGDRWFLDPSSVDRRLRFSAPVGRSFSARNAWALLLLLNSGGRYSGKWLERLSPWARSRARTQLKSRDLSALVPRLRGRAIVRRLRAHPSDIARFAAEPGVVRSGVSAASDYDIDIVAPGEVEAYVPARLFPKLVKKYRFDMGPNPNVILHVVEDKDWPFSRSCKVAPPCVAAIDLIEADDERSRRAGRALLGRSSQSVSSQW